MRIVSLTCSNTEIVCALGCADTLVAVDDHSDHPADVVAGLPRVGPDLGIDVDAVAALEPDLVLASLTVPGHERVVERLDAAGLPYVAPAPVSLDDVFRDVRDIGALLGVSQRAERLVDDLQRRLEALPRPSGDRPPVLVEWWPRPVYVPGRRSWVTDLLERVGGRNPFADRDTESLAVSDEEVRQAAPEAVVISWCGVPERKYRPEVVARRKGWAEVPAVQNGRIHCVPEAWLGRPGPRLVEGARALGEVIAAIGGGSDERGSAMGPG